MKRNTGMGKPLPSHLYLDLYDIQWSIMKKKEVSAAEKAGVQSGQYYTALRDILGESVPIDVLLFMTRIFIEQLCQYTIGFVDEE